MNPGTLLIMSKINERERHNSLKKINTPEQCPKMPRTSNIYYSKYDLDIHGNNTYTMPSWLINLYNL